ncbi:MAG TPA: hypothetical protein VIM75_22250 [Ohtaekwangia sp.]|uniref:hypothetical protein n=1 Tax=Ohtaekwangia sp. TaxID=2066019 RepID=UPI002F9295FE
MAYELVKKLKECNQEDILKQLSSHVRKNEKQRGKLHEVFEPSFDWKESVHQINFWSKKLNYIHENPCRGKWNLAHQISDYKHSSAEYYITGKQGIYEITNYTELQDIDLTKPLLEL